jgi:hypothetical protein
MDVYYLIFFQSPGYILCSLIIDWIPPEVKFSKCLSELSIKQ